MSGDRVECPACGGAGGGPFGRAGSAWDVETYECPRCEGTGRVQLPSSLPLATTVTGLAKTTADPAQRPELPRKDAAKAGPKKAPAASPAATTRRAGKTGGRKSRG